MTGNTPTTFMTGATGFLGHFILGDLLNRGRRVVVMVRPPLEQSTRRIEQLLRGIGVDPTEFIDRDQLVLVEGALPDQLPENCDWGPTSDILACAASLQLFTNGNQEPIRTNVEGAKATTEWARRHGIKRIHAVSTAYSCGSYTESVREVFHHPMPEFKTAYEQTKWIAETIYAGWAEEPGNVLTVSRPSFLVGHSETGYTTQFGGFYQLARVVSLLKEQFSDGNPSEPTYVHLRIPGRPEDPQNLVPVDFAARIITEIILHENLHGRIYHLTDPNPASNDHIKRCLEDYFNLTGGYFVEPGIVSNQSPAEELIWQGYDVLTPRVAHNPVFIQDNTREVMQTFGIEFPKLDRKRIFNLFDYAVSRNWGLRTRGSYV